MRNANEGKWMALFGTPSADSQRVAALYREHKTEYLRIGYYYLQSVELAEEAVQEAFARFLRVSGRHAEWADADMHHYIRVVVKNVCLDMIAKEKRWAQDYDELKDPEVARRFAVSVEDAVESKLLWQQAMNKLTNRQRSCLIMRDLWNWEYRDIAECLNIAKRNLPMLYSRAKKTLRKELSELQQAGEGEGRQHAEGTLGKGANKHE